MPSPRTDLSTYIPMLLAVVVERGDNARLARVSRRRRRRLADLPSRARVVDLGVELGIAVVVEGVDVDVCVRGAVVLLVVVGDVVSAGHVVECNGLDGKKEKERMYELLLLILIFPNLLDA